MSQRSSLVSIHAPVKGATWLRRLSKGFMPCFNSRARKGRDQQQDGGGAMSHSFNSRARKGRDRK